MPNLTQPKCQIIAALLTVALARTLCAQPSETAPVIAPPIANGTTTRIKSAGKDLLNHAKWTTPLQGFNGRLEVVGQTLLFWNLNGNARNPVGPTALDRETGRVLWQSPFLPSQRNETVLTKDGLEYLVDNQGKLELIRLAPDNGTNKTVWQTPFKVLNDADRAGPPGPNVIPIFSDQVIFAGERPLVSRQPPTSMAIRSFDRKTGSLKWETPVPEKATSATVATSDGRVYATIIQVPAQSLPPVVQPQGFIMALDAATGNFLWKTDPLPLACNATPYGSLLIAITQDGDAVAFDAQTGKGKWRTPLSAECDPNKSKLGTLRAAGGIYVVNDKLLATVDQFPAGAAAGPGGFGGMRPVVGSIALLNPRNGKQTGYFTTNGITGDFPTQQIPMLAQVKSHKNTLFVNFQPNNRCLCIDLPTLKVQWEIDATWTVADGTLYVSQRTPAGTAEILAIPLDTPQQPKKDANP